MSDVQQFRDFGVRLKEFCILNNYTLIADALDYIVLEDKSGYRFQCSGYSIHLAMIKDGII